MNKYIYKHLAMTLLFFECGNIYAGDNSISDGTAVFKYISFSVPQADFSTAEDHLFTMWYWYRVAGDSDETALPPPDNESYVADTATLDWDDVDGNGLFDAQLVHIINQPSTGTATLVSTLKLTNISGGDVVIDWFNYFDFDVGLESFGNEALLTQDPGFITISDNGITVEQRAGGNDSYEVKNHPVILSALTNASLDNLDNSGLPFGPGDFTGAFQWASLIIPAGGSYTIETTTSIDTAAPVPSSPVIVTNDAPNTATDSYSLNEDDILTAFDSDGSVNNANDDSVLVNDTDPESDPLSVVSSGTFTASGIGGSITIAADGTFVYFPPTDVSGTAGLVFDVTDGFNTVSSSLSIDVLPVNDAPAFMLLGGVDATNQVGVGNTQIQIPGFAHSLVFGPTDENGQNVQQFNLVVSDFDAIVNTISIDNNGTLDIDFSLNFGVALIDATLQDNGGTANGGVDTSAAVKFVIAHFDLVFADDFESGSGLRLFDYLASVTHNYPLNNLPTYDFNSDRLSFYGHTLQLHNDYASPRVMLLVQYWLQAVLIKEDPFGDYDLDGIFNIDDENPLKF